jgi:hypothetical protein
MGNREVLMTWGFPGRLDDQQRMEGMLGDAVVVRYKQSLVTGHMYDARTRAIQLGCHYCKVIFDSHHPALI